tara:strand:- start:94 stop:738 length:645 start_codon:yes stop_codon:yes gene_type:complete
LFKFSLILVYIFIIFFISKIYKIFNPNNKETLRKIVHIGIGPLIPFAKFLDIEQTSALYFTGLVTLLTFINYQSKLFPAIEDIERKSYGTLFYCLSLFILIYVYWNKDSASLIAGFFIMTFGDGFAGLIGKNFKSKKWIFLNQTKSLFGTMTMFITSFIVVFGLSYFQGYPFSINFFTIAFISTLFEQVSIFGIDNFIVPISAAFFFNLFITGL